MGDILVFFKLDRRDVVGKWIFVLEVEKWLFVDNLWLECGNVGLWFYGLFCVFVWMDFSGRLLGLFVL